jgi:hypothetical protein
MLVWIAREVDGKPVVWIQDAARPTLVPRHITL